MQKISRSKIELFLDCQKCFWLDVKHKIKRPPPAPYTINNAVDYLLKQEFDVHRALGTQHPVMEKFAIDAIPYKTPEIDKWRHNFTGVQHTHEPSGFLITGAVDDVWVNPKRELIVVDYKATGAREHRIYDSYKRQMEVYQWLLRQNGYAVSPVGYFVFARVNKSNGFGNGLANTNPESGGGTLAFDLFLEPQEGNDAWIPDTLLKIRTAFDSDEAPRSADACVYCSYRAEADNY